MESEITSNMMKHEMTEADNPNEDIWHWSEGSLKEGPYAQLSVKVPHMAGGKVHMQFTCADVAGLHEDMKEHLGTPFVFLGESAMRNYGVSINLSVKHGSIDANNLDSLSKAIQSDGDCFVQSCASEAEDYAVMQFRGVVDGEDNNGVAVKMLDFRIGAEKNRMLIAFSHVPSALKTESMNYPEMRGEWFLAWLCSRYFDTQEEE